MEVRNLPGTFLIHVESASVVVIVNHKTLTRTEQYGSERDKANREIRRGFVTVLIERKVSPKIGYHAIYKDIRSSTE